MEKKKGIKIRFTVAIIIIELVFLISMMTIYYIYHLADNKKRAKMPTITEPKIIPILVRNFIFITYSPLLSTDFQSYFNINNS